MLIRSFRYSLDWNIARLWKFSCLSDWWRWWCWWYALHFCRTLSCIRLIYGSDFSKQQFPKSLCNKRIFNRYSSSYFSSFFFVSVFNGLIVFFPHSPPMHVGNTKDWKQRICVRNYLNGNNKKFIRALSAQFWAQFFKSCMLRVHGNSTRAMEKRQKRGFFRNENDIAIIGQTASPYEWEKKSRVGVSERARASGRVREREAETAKQTMNQFRACFVFFLLCLCSLFILQMLELSTTFNNNTKCIAHTEKERKREKERTTEMSVCSPYARYTQVKH